MVASTADEAVATGTTRENEAVATVASTENEAVGRPVAKGASGTDEAAAKVASVYGGRGHGQGRAHGGRGRGQGREAVARARPLDVAGGGARHFQWVGTRWARVNPRRASADDPSAGVARGRSGRRPGGAGQAGDTSRRLSCGAVAGQAAVEGSAAGRVAARRASAVRQPSVWPLVRSGLWKLNGPRRSSCEPIASQCAAARRG